METLIYNLILKKVFENMKDQFLKLNHKIIIYGEIKFQINIKENK